MQDVHGSREHDACEHVAFLAQDACCWEQDGGCVKQDVHSGREHDAGEEAQAQTWGSAHTITLTVKCGLFLMSILAIVVVPLSHCRRATERDPTHSPLMGRAGPPGNT